MSRKDVSMARGGLRIVIAVLTTGFSLSACSSTSWKEEVLLHDGQRIIVERSQTYGGRHEVGQSPPVSEHSIRFIPPKSNSAISWTSEYDGDLGRTNFKLIALDFFNGVPYLVAVPNLCLAYNKWGRPNPPYVIFKHDGTKWDRIPLNGLPAGLKETNLVINNQGEADVVAAQSVVSAEQIKKLNGELTQPEYKNVVRVSIKSGSGATACEELVHYKCGWGAPGEFNRKYFENTCK